MSDREQVIASDQSGEQNKVDTASAFTQQIISAAPSPAPKSASEQFAEVVEDFVEEEPEKESPNHLEKLFPNMLPITVQPRVVINVLAGENDEEVPKYFEMGGVYYSTVSPFRKGKGNYANKADATGLLRLPLVDFVHYLYTNLLSKKLTFFGSLPIEDQVNEFAVSLSAVFNDMLGGKLQGLQGYEDFQHITNCFSTDSWVTATVTEDSCTIHPVFILNVVVPLLVTAQSPVASLLSMKKAIEVSTKDTDIPVLFSLAENLADSLTQEDSLVLQLLNESEPVVVTRDLIRRINADEDVQDPNHSLIKSLLLSDDSFNVDSLFPANSDVLFFL